MSVITKPRGVPPGIAIFDFKETQSKKVNGEFWDACSQLYYGDWVAIARALGIHYKTVMKWRYKIQLPNYETRILIIEWVKQGKPIRREADAMPGIIKS